MNPSQGESCEYHRLKNSVNQRWSVVVVVTRRRTHDGLDRNDVRRVRRRREDTVSFALSILRLALAAVNASIVAADLHHDLLLVAEFGDTKGVQVFWLEVEQRVTSDGLALTNITK